MSLSNQILDFNDDTQKVIFKQIMPSIPSNIKTASVVDNEQKQTLGQEQFALVILTKEGSELKKFPINDFANTWLSSQYFAKTAEKLPAKARVIAAGHLKAACAFFNIKAPAGLEKIASTAVSSNKYIESTDMTKVAHVAEFERATPDESKHFYALRRSYAMPNPEYVKKAQAYFSEYEFEFADAEDRHTFANNVIERAKELQMSPEQFETLQKYASEGYGDIVETQIKIRKDLLENKPEMSAALSKLASHRATTDAGTFAKVLYAFDKKAGLERYYDGYIADAFKATFETRFTKKASGYSWENDSGDLSLTDKEIEKIAEDGYDKIKGYFGETVAKQLKKHGSAIFESLPVDAKEVIAKIAKGKI